MISSSPQERNDEKNSMNGKAYVSEIKDIESHHDLTTIRSPNGDLVTVDTHPGYGVDEAMAAAEEYEDVEIDPADDAKLRRKLDYTILPLFTFLYVIQFIDKTCVGYAAIMGIQLDYNMEGQMYSWTTSAVHLGYLFGSPFAAYLLQRFPTVKTCATFIIIWGIVQATMAGSTTYVTLMLCRTLLGILEAFVAPIFVIILNQYYKKTEHFGRSAVFYGCSGLGSIFMGAVAAGLYTHKESYHLEAYKILFIIIGLMTLIIGSIILLFIPDTPAQSKWLSKKEKALVISRIRGNQQGFGSKKFKIEQVWECLRDVRTWIYFLIALCSGIPNGGVTSFTTIIIKNMGYSTVKALLMKMPIGAFEVTFLCILPWLNSVIKSRLLITDIYLGIVIAGMCLVTFASNTAALVGIWLYGLAPVCLATASSCVSSNTAGHTKKLTTNALLLMAWSAGNIIGPQTFRASEAPDYPSAKATFVGTLSATFVLVAAQMILNIRENHKRDKLRLELGDEYVVVKNQEFADLTDFQNPEFRYAY